MTEQEIKEELCYYDLRNPDVVGIYGMTKEELKEDGYGNHAKKDCSCDNCFYGRTKMAEELLKYVSNVVGRSEQFYCDGQENNKNRCETQCLGCAEMQEIYGQ